MARFAHLATVAAVAVAGLALACSDSAGAEADTDTNTDSGGVTSNGHATSDSGRPGDGDGDVCTTAETNEVESCPVILGEGFCSEYGSHVEADSEIEWGNNPPHSGDHYPAWANWGEYDEPVARGTWVHNLEHGGIVLIYNCPEGCDAELDVLRAVMEAKPDFSMLMTEDALLDAPRFAAISWNWVYEFDVPVLEELICFVDQHYDQAPESVL